MQAWAPEGVDLFQLGWCDCRGYRDAVAVLLRRNLNNFLLVIYWRFLCLHGWLFLHAEDIPLVLWSMFSSVLMLWRIPWCHYHCFFPEVTLETQNVKVLSEKIPAVRFQNKIHKCHFIFRIVCVQYILQDWKVNIHKPYSVGHSNSCLGIASKYFSSSQCTLNCNVKTSMYFTFFFVHTCRKPMQPFSFLN